MQIGRIEGADAVIGEEQGYGRLPIKAEVIFDEARQHPALSYTSAWIPTPDEIERIVAGAAVHVRVLYGQPPINVTVGLPPRD